MGALLVSLYSPVHFDNINIHLCACVNFQKRRCFLSSPNGTVRVQGSEALATVLRNGSLAG